MNHSLAASTALCTIALGASLSAVSPAQAQDTSTLFPVRAKIGVLMPSDKNTRNFSGSTQFNIEADLALPNLGQGKYFVSAGYSQGSRSGNKLRVIPVTIGRMFSPLNPAKSITGNLYFGAGVGPYFLRASNGVASASKTTVGGYGVVGYQLPNPYFVEAKYHLAGKVAGINPSGLAVMVGRRF